MTTHDWEKLTPEALERIRKAGFGDGGQLWLCIPGKHGETPNVDQGDYVGKAVFPGSKEQHDAFMTTLGQLISVSDVSHTMPFHPPAPPVDFVPLGSSLHDKNHRHPRDYEPRTEACQAALNERGDNKGRGLDLNWKWGFASGFNAALDAARPAVMTRIKADNT